MIFEGFWQEVKTKKKIKPCPFCGEVPVLHKNDELGLIKIMCLNEDCPVHAYTPKVFADKEEELIGIWNTRKRGKNK